MEVMYFDVPESLHQSIVSYLSPVFLSSTPSLGPVHILFCFHEMTDHPLPKDNNDMIVCNHRLKQLSHNSMPTPKCTGLTPIDFMQAMHLASIASPQSSGVSEFLHYVQCLQFICKLLFSSWVSQTHLQTRHKLYRSLTHLLTFGRSLSPGAAIVTLGGVIIQLTGPPLRHFYSNVNCEISTRRWL